MSISYFSSVIMFSDLMKCSTGWEAAGGGAITTDALGHITAINSGYAQRIVLVDDFAIDNQIPWGNYLLRYTGQGDILVAFGSATISGRSYNSTTNKTTATLNYQGGSLWLRLNSIPNPANPPRAIELIMPGDSNYGQPQNFYVDKIAAGDPYYYPFVRRLEGYLHVIRWMGYLGTNGAILANWADRTTPAHATQARREGGSLEYAIDLCNKLNTNCWVCVPHTATDDYMLQMAQFCLGRLNSNLTLYVEFSNEHWNYAGAYTQTYWLAENVGQAIDPTAPFFVWAAKGAGKRIVDMCKIFTSVWTGANRARLRLVGGLQLGNVGINDITFKQYVDPVDGARAGDLVDEMASAPYFSANQGFANFYPESNGYQLSYEAVRNTIALDDTTCFNQLREDFAPNGPMTQALERDIQWINANFPGTLYTTYECGQHLECASLPADFDEFGQPTNVYENSAVAKISSKYAYLNRHPQMKVVYLEWFARIKNYFPNAPAVLLHYVSAADDAGGQAYRYGTWGHQGGLLQPMSQNPKLEAVMIAAGVDPADYEL